MKWLLGLLVTAGLALGAFYGAGYFVMPASLTVSRSIDIERPTSIIYPLIANLRAFNEFSPWFDDDPKADYRFGGPREGQGQEAEWVSSVQSVGAGRQKVLLAQENQRVEIDHYVAGRNAHAAWTFGPGKLGATKVTWAMRHDCGPSILAVPCRYLNFIERDAKAKQYEAGLAKLKAIAEKLPALEIASLKPQFVTVKAQDFAYVDADTTDDDASIAKAVVEAQGVVRAFLTRNALTSAGPLFAIIQKQEANRISLRVGIPFTGPAPTTQIEAKTGKTPEGAALKVTNVGQRDVMRPIYARIDAYVAAHRLERSGGSWEVYLDDPATTPPDQMRTAIYYPLKPFDDEQKAE